MDTAHLHFLHPNMGRAPSLSSSSLWHPGLCQDLSARGQARKDDFEAGERIWGRDPENNGEFSSARRQTPFEVSITSFGIDFFFKDLPAAALPRARLSADRQAGVGIWRMCSAKLPQPAWDLGSWKFGATPALQMRMFPYPAAALAVSWALHQQGLAAAPGAFLGREWSLGDGFAIDAVG